MSTLSRFALGASAAAIVVGSLVIRAPALAQSDPPSAGADREARALFDAGEVAYGNAHYLEALDDFERAYELTQRAPLLFNIGLAAQRAERFDRALRAYEAYLAATPQAANRLDVEARIVDCRAARAAQVAALPPTPHDGGESPTPSGPGVLPWIVIAGGGALVIGGGVFVALALSDVSAVEDAPVDSAWSDVSGAYDRAPLFSTLGFVLAGVGLAGVALGIVLLGTGDDSEPEVRVSLGPGSLRLAGRF